MINQGDVPTSPSKTSRSWIHLLREAGVTFVSGVPDSALKSLVADLEQPEGDGFYVLSTREDNAISLAVGAYLAGARPLVFMKSAGLGTSLDVLTSLAIVYEIPVVLLIGWSGYAGLDVPHHNVIGEPLEPILMALGLPIVKTSLAGSPDDVVLAVRQALDEAVAHKRPAAILVIP